MFKGITTSKTEIKDILIAWLVIAFVMTIVTTGLGRGFFFGLIIALFTVGVAFVVHELSHKVVAQRMGYSADFKKFTPMLVLSVILSFLGLVFVAPGAVVVRGLGITGPENGKISLAGPLSNLIMGFVAIIASFFVPTAGIKGVLIFFAFVNCMIGLFNMIPFWVMDGKKVFTWDKRVYTGVLVLFFMLYLIIKINLNF